MSSSVSHANALVSFSFYSKSSFADQKELRIGAFNKESQAFPIYFSDPETTALNQEWMCPRAYLETYITDFFHFTYDDSKKPDGFQVDCVMMPSILVGLKNNDMKVCGVLRTVLRMLEMFSTHGGPSYTGQHH